VSVDIRSAAAGRIPLGQIIGAVEEFGDELIVYAPAGVRVLPETPVYLVDEENGEPPAGTVYVLGLILVKEVLRVWSAWRNGAKPITDLLKLAERRGITLQVVPNAGYFPGVRGPFDIAIGIAISDTVNMVTVEDHVSDEPDAVATVIALFEEIRSYALNAADSRALVTEATQRWKSRQQ
jgi:hypothetical protein